MVLAAAVAKLGLCTVALACSLAFGALAAALLWRTRGQTTRIRRSDDETDLGKALEQSKRDRLTVIRTTAGFAIVPSALAIAVMVVRAPDCTGFLADVLGEIEGQRLWIWRSIVGAATVIATSVYLSTLLDWCVVVPRLRGLGRWDALPCRRPSKTDWRSTTQLWITHRIIAYSIVRLMALVIVAVTIVAIFPRIPATTASFLGAVAGLIGAYFINRVLPIAGLMTNPPMAVGDRITLAEEYGTGVNARPAYYVVDAAIEGFSLIEVDDHDRAISASPNTYPQPDRTLDLKDVTRLLRSRRPFDGCQARCSKVNGRCPHDLGDPIHADTT